MRRGVRYLKLKHLNASGVHPSGNARLYYRPKGQKGIPLPDLPKDDPEFLAAYAKAAGVIPHAPVRDGSLGAAMLLYKASDTFAGYADSTRAVRARKLDEAIQMYGHASRVDLQKKHIEKDLSRFTGHARNGCLKVWRGFCAWLVQHYGLDADPSDGIKRAKTAKSDGHIPWSNAEIEKFRAFWPIGTMERLAFELILWTGARVSDAIRLGRGNIDRHGWLIFRQQKGGGEVAVPFNRDLPAFAEAFADDLMMLKQAINARNERHITFLHTQRGAARSSKSVSQWFAAKARQAGIQGRTAHGLRKSRAEALFEHGATMAQGQAWLGHSDPRMLNHYAKKYDKRRALTRTETEQKVPTSPIKFQKEGK